VDRDLSLEILEDWWRQRRVEDTANGGFRGPKTRRYAPVQERVFSKLPLAYIMHIYNLAYH